VGAHWKPLFTWKGFGQTWEANFLTN